MPERERWVYYNEAERIGILPLKDYPPKLKDIVCVDLKRRLAETDKYVDIRVKVKKARFNEKTGELEIVEEWTTITVINDEWTDLMNQGLELQCPWAMRTLQEERPTPG